MHQEQEQRRHLLLPPHLGRQHQHHLPLIEQVNIRDHRRQLNQQGMKLKKRNLQFRTHVHHPISSLRVTMEKRSQNLIQDLIHRYQILRNPPQRKPVFQLRTK